MCVSPFCSSDKRSRTMLDIFYFALGLGGFGLMAGYAALCKRL